jgi:hypothetical protein
MTHLLIGIGVGIVLACIAYLLGRWVGDWHPSAWLSLRLRNLRWTRESRALRRRVVVRWLLNGTWPQNPPPYRTWGPVSRRWLERHLVPHRRRGR